MAAIDKYEPGTSHFLLGNEAIARGALERGVNFVTGYPGTPSSEIVPALAQCTQKGKLHAEWSTNELAAVEGAAAAATAGLLSLSAMKNAGLSLALDFITHLSYTGLGPKGGACLMVVCDDPHGHSSGDETDSRWLARFATAPMVEPMTGQQAVELVKYAFDISQKHSAFVFYRGYTRLSHASNPITMGELPTDAPKASSDSSVSLNPYLSIDKHQDLLAKMEAIRAEFEQCPFNTYQGPQKPELVVVASGAGHLAAAEALETLGLEERVGLLSLATIWPLPTAWVMEHLKNTSQVLVLEEVDPFMETAVKEALVDNGLGTVAVYGKGSGHIPMTGEMTPDRALTALARIFDLKAPARDEAYERLVQQEVAPLVISRGLSWCAGCPHRASFWALDKAIKADARDAYVTGEIGCSTLDVFPEGKAQIKLLHSMGSGTGTAAGLGQLKPFGYTQPVVAVCGDSSFFHSSVPRLINAVYNQADMLQIILDNSATAMTGFQPHPGTGNTAENTPAPRLDVAKVCRSIGCEVTIADPFEVRATTKVMRELMGKPGVQVLILRRACELVRMKAAKSHPFRITIDQEKCKGTECAVCSRDFRCPALYLDPATGKTAFKEQICSGCGVCVEICPFKAISKQEND
ncbi:MAG: 4Fe-4S binding protein [Proteobacteria bacterium]|nr:4Fe-4S binding protein [Pseudomonadota bacterium]MBU4278736.1 4Fe-4S binding protein [Pseudomonadota bacterium]MBU4385047.1 4Fe-4S binding protein [Pseudomonadota bacterium]MBU4604664.1 4Fe-4S binding protein [Pseudomonadota bacterium]MCG2763169.1 thiamine pyrophosphate-dependent enzyme [Desulfarculaceae bacterium]